MVFKLPLHPTVQHPELVKHPIRDIGYAWGSRKCEYTRNVSLEISPQHFTPSVLRHPHFFSYKNRYNSQFPVIPPLPPGFLSVVLGFRHVFSCACFFFVFYAQLPFHCSHGEALHVKFMYQCPVSSAVLLLSTSTF
ncbi:hypothetical protein PHYBLDRAFT_184771 [Phycomyces blakesleeanus NRRL 1555(-)]|uniref:Uncharacterized protein n=1 Tax=Phycomyces blakesleeanus (strain ATCC 8743b / DSM 1359 / FGSC 10004 / NBRC 33097 / NRRL 1555) TaxID=763407 RepID=A0A163BBE1_PHYB8|nr:hypothetical protein PHYBLDRAFT_184771 [Phycomyces blakesleeanus NRRL 1555(-)]OAD79431.1 hypothetical protein PHYBLDRAFT_184771 [Phycomyces blakesleeanus NRRL 1555(-)]|eukprot:XP_018297471.1 hypothetical protein PHYBLDRAFT_184771 [Phycomyces blakesleeanus NRRL 1555(-)]